jgi:hypothetical protein
MLPIRRILILDEGCGCGEPGSGGELPLTVDTVVSIDTPDISVDDTTYTP